MPRGRRASWLDEELRQPETFGCQLIDARRRCPTQLPAAVSTDVAVTDVVGEDEGDVGLFVLCGGRGGSQADSPHDQQRDEGGQRLALELALSGHWPLTYLSLGRPATRRPFPDTTRV
jgi:hypothetical protein